MALRTFIALEFSTSTRQQLGTLIQQLSKTSPPRTVKWVSAEALHLTLKFLGDTTERAVPKIVTALEGLHFEPFTLTTSHLGCFPNSKQPRVIWLGFDSESAAHLKKLNAAVEAAIAPLGFPTEARPFSPHLTLGRVRKEAGVTQAAQTGEAARALTNVPTLTDSISSIVLMKSELRPTGPIYTPLHKSYFLTPDS
jgi:2'-5' RNA ligase